MSTKKNENGEYLNPLLMTSFQSVQLADTYVEIIGTVDGGCGIRMLGGVGLGNDLGMS